MPSNHPSSGIQKGITLTLGAGQAIQMPFDEVSGLHGPVEDVVRRLERELIHDADLKAMLEDPSTVYELFTTAADGTSEEVPVSPHDEWQELIRKAEEQEVELGLARSHKGG